jgi:hypothetical protein
MKEDYLWDKMGEDPEIERLENALRVFRYQETAPPALPAKIIPFEKKNRWSFLHFSFASAALAALMIVCLGVWLQISPKKTEIAKDSPETQRMEIAEGTTETIAPQPDRQVSDDIPLKKSKDFVVRKVEMHHQPVKRNVVKIRKSLPITARQSNLIARNVKVKKPAVILTKEEKYAYDQLMLALSITGSKLKLVSDKVSGGEE